MEFRRGMLVKSKAGRDKNCIYVVGDVKNEYVYLTDGASKPLCRMKKKNRKHLQPILKAGTYCPDRDVEIREIIRKYKSGGDTGLLLRED